MQIWGFAEAGEGSKSCYIFLVGSGHEVKGKNTFSARMWDDPCKNKQLRDLAKGLL